MAKYKVAKNACGGSGMVDPELGRVFPGEEVEATAAQAKARPWLNGGGKKSAGKKSTKAAKDAPAADAEE